MNCEHIKKEEAMLFSEGCDWHLDIFLESNVQIMEIHLKAFSEVNPDFIYNITWNLIRQNGQQTQIPIDVSKINHSTISEDVILFYEIKYCF